MADLGGEPAEDLLTQVETVLREILKTVSGQFISYNKNNQQFYLDLKKTEDFDAIIERRAGTLDEDQLNRAYYAALRRVMEKTDQPTYATGYDIWPHEVTWWERQAAREGYLFYGTPNQRSTAIPPRDFYLYFIQLYNVPAFKDEKKPDEVFFRLTGLDADFEGALRRYAGALALASTASGHPKQVYQSKAGDFLKEMIVWLREHLMTAFEVTSQGNTKNIPERLKSVDMRKRLGLGAGDRVDNLLDYFNLVGSVCLAAHFESLAPEYPVFSVQVTARNRGQAVQDALRWISGRTQTKQGAAVLDALELLDGERLAPQESRYAKHILNKFAEKGHGQVVNRGEIIQDVQGVEYMAPERFRLEPEWVVVVLAALVYNGDIILAIPGKKFDANDLETLLAKPVNDLVHFKQLEQHKEWNLPALRALFELLGLPAGRAQMLARGSDEPVAPLQDAIGKTTERLVFGLLRLHQAGLKLWGKPLLTDEEAKAYQSRLSAAKSFLESLQAYNTLGKLKNFRYSVEEVQAHEAGLKALGEVEALEKLVTDLSPPANYLAQAETVLPEDHPWVGEMRQARGEIMAEIDKPEKRNAPGFLQQTKQRLATLKQAYITAYAKLLRQARLDLEQDKRKAAILDGPRLRTLQQLAQIPILPAGQLEDARQRLAALRTAASPRQKDLEQTPVLDGFMPSIETLQGSAADRLGALDHQIDDLLERWTQTLLDNLAHESTQEALGLLGETDRQQIAQFREARALPDPLDSEFIGALKDALSGLHKVVVSVDDLKTRLFEGGAPATPDELKTRFDTLLDDLTKGHDAQKVRIVLE